MMSPRRRRSSTRTMILAPIQTLLPHLIGKLSLNPKRNYRRQTKPNHKRSIAHMTNFMHHQRHARELTPCGRIGGTGGGGRDTGVLATRGPDLLGFGHAILEVGVDFGDFFFGDHGLDSIDLVGGRRQRFYYLLLDTATAATAAVSVGGGVGC